MDMATPRKVRKETARCEAPGLSGHSQYMLTIPDTLFLRTFAAAAPFPAPCSGHMKRRINL
jgi:hypothetical protein